MKLTNQIISLFLLTSSTVLAFAPTTPSTGNVLGKQFRQHSWQPSVATKLFMSDGPADQFKDQLEELKDSVDERTKFLVVDVNQARDELAKNWGWIAGAGVLTMALGVLSLTVPIFATGVAYDGTVLTLGATGLVSLFSVFVRENGHKLKSGLSGLGYLAVAYYMGGHPAEGLDIITLAIATVIAAEGFFETTLAIKNKDLQGRGWHAATGIVSTLAGLFLSANIPAASLVAPGAALGTRLTSNGATKIAVGLAGKQIADQRK